MKRCLLSVCLVLLSASAVLAKGAISPQSQSCLNCHRGFTPGIVADWESSRHSRTTPAEALGLPAVQRRMSAETVGQEFLDNVVGCYECHGQNTDRHADSFEHFGFTINVVVSPRDCATCHPVEEAQYTPSKKGNAWGNLKHNPVYHALVDSVIGPKEVEGTGVTAAKPSAYTEQEACFACHGTKLEVRGMRSVETRLGTIKVPEIAHWPNQGVGRINPDGSKGACTSCHPRHSFSIEVARKPHTCAQCHLEPDVPAWNVYAASKHGNIYLSRGREWDFDAVPWRIGKDFTAPTCATCHVSLLATPDGGIVVERSHDFSSRLWVRLFGLIYSTAQPISGDTSVIRNADGLPMPVTFLGEPASGYLIDRKEQLVRKGRMESVCRACHATSWVRKHFEKMDNTIAETDRMTLQATKLMMYAWEHGLADDSDPFDEALEQKWIRQWLFYANTAKYASAMSGAQDYVAFKYGWWGLSTNLQEMKDKIEAKEALGKLKKDDD